jgi:hypothetical protein
MVQKVHQNVITNSLYIKEFGVTSKSPLLLAFMEPNVEQIGSFFWRDCKQILFQLQSLNQKD